MDEFIIPQWIIDLLKILAGGLAGGLTTIILAYFARKKEASLIKVNEADAELKKAQAEKERADADQKVSDNMRKWIADLEEKIDQLESKNKCNNENLAKYEKDIIDIRVENSKLKSEIRKLSDDYTLLTSKYTDLSVKYDVLLAENVKLRKQIQEQEVLISNITVENKPQDTPPSV